MTGENKNKLFPRRVWEAALLILLLPIVVPLAVVGLILHTLNKFVVYSLVWLLWLPKGKNVLFVSSDSPVWHEYMETQIFPHVEHRAVVLNWSKREHWPRWSFAVRVFRAFSRGRDFNPMVVLFRPFRRARVFRFLPAFKEWKHGRVESVEKLRRDLMQAL
jgi:hypothetical protein